MAEEMTVGPMYHRHYHENRDRDCGRRDSGLEEVIADGVQRLQHDVPESTASIKDSIQASTNSASADARHIVDVMCGDTNRITHGLRDNADAIGKAECELGKQIGDVKFQVSNSECAINKEVIQNRFEGLQSENRILKALDDETDRLKERLAGFERSVDRQFCDLKADGRDNTRLILQQMNADKLDEKNDEIARLRAKCDRNESDLFIGNQISSLTALVNSHIQDQRFTSVIKQNGIGNAAIPVQSQTQM